MPVQYLITIELLRTSVEITITVSYFTTHFNVKMNKLVLLALCALAVSVAYAEEEKFTDKYDNVDLDEVLKNERLFNSYYKCLMDQGKCTAEGAELKSELKFNFFLFERFTSSIP